MLFSQLPKQPASQQGPLATALMILMNQDGGLEWAWLECGVRMAYLSLNRLIPTSGSPPVGASHPPPASAIDHDDI